MRRPTLFDCNVRVIEKGKSVVTKSEPRPPCGHKPAAGAVDGAFGTLLMASLRGRKILPDALQVDRNEISSRHGDGDDDTKPLVEPDVVERGASVVRRCSCSSGTTHPVLQSREVW